MEQSHIAKYEMKDGVALVGRIRLGVVLMGIG